MHFINTSLVVLGTIMFCQLDCPSLAFSPIMGFHRSSIATGHKTSTTSPSSVVLRMFFADETPDDHLDVSIETCGEDDNSIGEAASFLIDAFWLDRRHLVNDSGETLELSEEARKKLLKEQTLDLVDKYGERMGKPILDYAILVARDGKSQIQGMVCISGLVFDRQTDELMAYGEAESLLKTAVASLGPSERRKYKNCGATEIADDLFGRGEMEAVCCLSNLAVSPAARRSGIAMKLCDEAERIAAVEWGFDVMLLRVEDDNVAARRLYEEKLGYTFKCLEAAATALRVDMEGGNFVPTEADTLILEKEL